MEREILNYQDAMGMYSLVEGLPRCNTYFQYDIRVVFGTAGIKVQRYIMRFEAPRIPYCNGAVIYWELLVGDFEPGKGSSHRTLLLGL